METAKDLQIGTYILTNDEKADTVWPTTVLLGVCLRTYRRQLCNATAIAYVPGIRVGTDSSRSAIPCMIRATGMGRPYSIRDDMACWRIKFLLYQLAKFIARDL